MSSTNMSKQIENLRNINLGVVTRVRKSKFIEPFWKDEEKPAGVLCCQFYELKWSNGCVFACDYCYLKGTFRWQGWKGRRQTVFSNFEDLKREVEEFLKLEKPYVLHTGEVSDSLAVPGSEELMAYLIRRFGEQDRHTLLLLTKSNNVDRLLDVKHNGMTVIGFSVNPEKVARKYEIGAPTTEERLAAAQKCIDAGYRVVVRVDPMIPINEWEKEYKHLFHKLNQLDLYGVVVGTLRAFPTTKHMMSQELQNMLVEHDLDGRWHLEKDLRFRMYRLAFRFLKFRRMGVCKETGVTWAKLISEFRDKRFICNCRL